ncbi:MAG TPA: tetratricopeptide repeat protein [Hydrogenophaga sp.]|uniref:tetratricopeptide repeat protein n=1 Tax=Hydrogenophaga sp. TaxID=1904254 RepID=UPI002C56532D|nr:tetratricopeptide repeat protein [Hydrogenophaga sp.]HMN93388.1 tetratricopeptide repeat protein [Hydrogenophaga sp.]HMP10281.1 tetratricopeptide repeat protein [Hydrogenophaga sp.]
MDTSLEQARTLFFRGNDHFEAGRLNEAADAYRQALAMAPGRPSVLANLGITLSRLGQVAEALPVLRQATAADPTHADAWLAQGVCAEAQGLWEEAVHALQQGTGLGQAAVGAPVWLSLGHCHGRLGRVAEALHALQRALALDPALAEAWSQRGSLLREQGQLREAAHCFEQALAHGADEALHRFYLASVRGEAVPHPPAAYVQTLFDDYAEGFQSHLVQALRYQAHEVLLAPLQASGRRFEHMLDLGCGTGLCAQRMQGQVARIDGVDLSPAMVAQARSSGLYRHVQEGDLLPFLMGQTAPVDLIVAADVFIYVGALDEVLAAARHCMAAGGVFAFSLEQAPAGQDLVLQPSLRYAHSSAYIERLAAVHGWQVARLEAAAIREDQQRPVMGWYVHLTPVASH